MQDEITLFEATVSPSALVEGSNVLAVEVHQINLTSTDLGFDLALLGVTQGTGNLAPSVALTSPANNAQFQAPASIALATTASDPDGTIARVGAVRR